MPKMKPKKEKAITPEQIRFIFLYLGGENGISFSNATMSYFYAYNGLDAEPKENRGDGVYGYTKQYRVANAEGAKLLLKPSIKAYMDKLMLEVGFDPKTIKKGFAKWAYQEKHPAIALSALDKVAKISGLLKEDSTVNIPQLEELTNNIKKILSH